MALGRQQDAEEQDLGMMPGLESSSAAPPDPRTFDPSQGPGTPEWQQARRRQAELNTRLGVNAHLRRN